jgi:hypothetical protein
VSIGTDAFVQNFGGKSCRTMVDDVEKLDSIQDVFIHLSSHSVTRLQYAHSHILIRNRCVLQQQHVDCKMTESILKRGTK